MLLSSFKWLDFTHTHTHTGVGVGVTGVTGVTQSVSQLSEGEARATQVTDLDFPVHLRSMFLELEEAGEIVERRPEHQ